MLAVLGGVRVFVPVVALLGDVPADGDKEADMAAVLMTGADGRQALLAFSSVATMAAWNADARPVPVWGRDAARAALDEDASAVLLDLATRRSPSSRPLTSSTSPPGTGSSAPTPGPPG